ncbi:aldo/keto reductase [Kibdelosporangium persicum]|uniref:Aldo/keto reductase, diketogulonate reductase n=1 Tax=Kibdelosporangium persicum TaxID=2698649 RepID=A0ABX2F830_9PSEU|nr:aldo/keto reductase [Kibdelosporangium persicum]NRN67052.1 Aldo/keto reductase, diketogulonate reductase [Kibdelosporangium persicum]
MAEVPTLTFNDGSVIPQIGYGVFMVPPEEAAQVTTMAIETGYRLIDTAAAYKNEEGVGKAVANSGIPADELNVTTKLWNDDHGYDRTMRAFDLSMSKLGMERLGIYLMHFPRPKQNLFVESWKAFEKLQADGRVRSIGVSNFGIPELRRLFDECDVVPAMNQIELHPMYPQEELRAFHAEHGIVTQAWSPIGRNQGLLEHPVVLGIAAGHDRSPAQVVLRWHIQLGIQVIPKSVNPDRIRSNFQIFDFELSDEEMSHLSNLGTEQRCEPRPGTLFDIS